MFKTSKAKMNKIYMREIIPLLQYASGIYDKVIVYGKVVQKFTGDCLNITYR